MLPSGNDAGMALAKWGGGVLGGDSKDFISMMNRVAIEIGMKSSTFGNPHGLPHPNNGSTAEDLCILISKCL
jgi:D-alanyl-D-alanine carboxypeptidase (penicillin-binding protein 5/6)